MNAAMKEQHFSRINDERGGALDASTPTGGRGTGRTTRACRSCGPTAISSGKPLRNCG